MAVKGMYLLDMGRYQSHTGRWIYGFDWDKRIIGQVFAALIITDDGNVLVDTGYPANDEWVYQWGQPGKSKASEMYKGDELKVLTVHDIRNRLKEHDLTVDDIDYVIISHLNYDHYGGMQFFENSTIIIHREEYNNGLNGEKFYRPHYQEKWDLSSKKHEFVESDKVIVPGVMVIHTPGHTIGHLSVIVDCPRDGTIILAGDQFHHEYNWLNRVPMGDLHSVPYPLLWFQSWDRIKAFADRSNALVIPSHDSEFWQKIQKEFH